MRVRGGCTRMAAGMCKGRGESRRVLNTEESPGPAYPSPDSGTKYRANQLSAAAASHRHTYEHRGCLKVPVSLLLFRRRVLELRFWAAFMLMLTVFSSFVTLCKPNRK